MGGSLVTLSSFTLSFSIYSKVAGEGPFLYLRVSSWALIPYKACLAITDLDLRVEALVGWAPLATLLDFMLKGLDLFTNPYL